MYTLAFTTIICRYKTFPYPLCQFCGAYSQSICQMSPDSAITVVLFIKNRFNFSRVSYNYNYLCSILDNSHPIQGCTSFQLLLLQLDGSHHRPQVHTCSRREGVSTRAPATARLWETRLQLPRLLCHGYGSQGAPGGAAAKPHHLFHFLSSVSNNLGEGNGIPLQYSCLENPGRLQSMGSLRVGHD